MRTRNRTSPNAELRPPDNTHVIFSHCANSPGVCSVPAALRNNEHIPAWVSAAYLQCHCLSSHRGAGLPCKTPNWSGTWHQSRGDRPQEHSQHTVQPWIAARGSQKLGFSSPCFPFEDYLSVKCPTMCRAATATHNTLKQAICCYKNTSASGKREVNIFKAQL